MYSTTPMGRRYRTERPRRRNRRTWVSVSVAFSLDGEGREAHLGTANIVLDQLADEVDVVSPPGERVGRAGEVAPAALDDERAVL